MVEATNPILQPQKVVFLKDIKEEVEALLKEEVIKMPLTGGK